MYRPIHRNTAVLIVLWLSLYSHGRCYHYSFINVTILQWKESAQTFYSSSLPLQISSSLQFRFRRHCNVDEMSKFQTSKFSNLQHFEFFIFQKSKFQILEIPNTQCFQMFQSSFFKTWEYQIMIAAFLKLLETTNKPQIIFFVIFFKKIMKGILVASAQLCRAILTS